MNEHQYQVTKAQLEMFNKAIAELQSSELATNQGEQWRYQAHLNSLKPSLPEQLGMPYHVGSSLDDVLKEDGVLDEVNSIALKLVTDWTDKVAGTFADSTSYDKAMKLGREYRGGEL